MFNQIILNSYEITSYWWINMIRQKVIELYTLGCNNNDEEIFLNLFQKFSDEDYRVIFQELAKYIYQDVKNAVYPDNRYLFCQETAKRYHGRLNTELALITNNIIPDINIHSRNMHNYRIYTNHDSAYQFFPINNYEILDNAYDDDYILSGNKELLNLYKSIIMTIKELSDKTNMISTNTLIKLFSEEYINYNKLKIDIKDMKLYLTYVINKLNDLTIIKGRSYDEKISQNKAMSLYLLSLKGYKRVGKHYANFIEKNKEKVLNK